MILQMEPDQPDLPRQEKELNNLSYKRLRETMLEWVQALSGDSWTNYNASDPGVTIIEQLSYMLSELGLRARRPIVELLAKPGSQHIDLSTQGLFPPKEILPGSALTLIDQRLSLLDLIPEAANIWLYPKKNGVNGVYRIEVMPRVDTISQCHCPSYQEKESQRLKNTVLICASSIRSLCEDHDEVTVLQPIPIRLHAKLILDEIACPNKILADLLFQLGLHFAPEPRRQSLESLLQRGVPATEIFHGPLLKRGFIAPDQLVDRPSMIRWNDLQNIIISVSGVLEIVELSLSYENQLICGPETTLVIRPGCFPVLHLEPDDFCEHLQPNGYNGELIDYNPDRVKILLGQLWHHHREVFNLDSSYSREFPVPRVADREDGAYSLLQNLFPSVYALANQDDLVLKANPKRLEQAMQLKGYLMIFDQLMADFTAQLGFLTHLFSPEAGGSKTYAYRSLRSLLGCEKEHSEYHDNCDLLINGYDDKLTFINQKLDSFIRRKGLILDFFLAIYGESLKSSDRHSMRYHETDRRAHLFLQTKQELLKEIVTITQNRGAGVDYRDPGLRATPTPFERRCALELRFFSSDSERHIPAIASCPEEATFGKLLTLREVDSRRLVRPSMIQHLKAANTRQKSHNTPGDLFEGHSVAPDLLAALAWEDNYRVSATENDSELDLICLDHFGRHWFVARLPDLESLILYLSHLLSRTASSMQSVAVVEWVLLRHALTENSNYHDLRKFNFHASIFVQSAVEMCNVFDQSDRMRRMLRPLIPAHIHFDIHILSPRRFRRFLIVRDAWLKSLATADEKQKQVMSCRILNWLKYGNHLRNEPQSAVIWNFQNLAGPMLILSPSTEGALGIRCEKTLDLQFLRSLKKKGIRFLLRSLPWRDKQSGVIDSVELTSLLDEGYAFMPIQNPTAAPIESSPKDMGRAHGEAAAIACSRLLIPSSCVVWLAGLPLQLKTDPSCGLQYLRAWSASIRRMGYVPGIFLTNDTPLFDLDVEWLCSSDIDICLPIMGISLTLADTEQFRDFTDSGIEVYRVVQDRRGRCPNWLVLDPRAYKPSPPSG